MKKLFSVLALFVGLIASAQDPCTIKPSRFDRIKLNCLSVSTNPNDSLAVIGSDGIVRTIPKSELLSSVDVPNLEQVTDVDSVTTNPIKIPVLRLYDSDNDRYSKLKFQNQNFLFYDNLNNFIFGFDNLGTIQRHFVDDNHTLTSWISGLTANRTRYEPDANGFYALSVNGTAAGSNGDISIAVGTGTVTGVTASSPLSISGTPSVNPNVAIANAAADNTTKGAASFTSDDFDSSLGNISIDYANGQKATASVPGFMSAADKVIVDGVVSTFQNQLTRKSRNQFVGKSMVFCGDSYMFGTGANAAYSRWTTIACASMGAIEVNHGVAGSTLEKRSPINWSGATNMLDRLSDIPTKTESYGLLTLALGLNDIGYTGANYNPTNFEADYAVVINDALSKGWAPEDIVIMTPYYIGSAGYAQYATITGLAAPTEARHLQFNQACRNVATTFNVNLLDMYSIQKRNNTTLFDSDPIHGNTASHAHIGNVYADTFSEEKLFHGSRASISSATPLQLNLGGTYANSAGAPSKAKLLIYDDGVNKVGFGQETAGILGTYSYPTFGMKWYSGTSLMATLAPTAGLTLVSGITATTGTFSSTISASNLSGTNTGDNATNTQYSGLATSKQDVLTSANYGTFSSSLTAKTTPVDADTVNISDSAASGNAKKVTASDFWTNYFKAKADAIYLSIANASSTYLPISGPTYTGNLTGPAFTVTAAGVVGNASVSSYAGRNYNVSGGGTAIFTSYDQASTASPTTGSSYGFNNRGTWSPTAGSSTFTGFGFNQTINAPASTGITRGLYINPTLTSAYDFRAIEATNGAVILPYRAVTTTSTLANNDYFVTVTGTITVTLPSVVDGKVLKIKNIGTGTVTLSGSIDGAGSKTMTVQYNAIELTGGGGVWNITGEF